jgi:hypothetical protein
MIRHMILSKYFFFFSVSLFIKIYIFSVFFVTFKT